MSKREELREKVLTKLIETGDTHLKNSEWELALQSYSSVAKKIDNEQLFLNMGACYFNLKSYYYSIIWLKRAFTINQLNKSVLEHIIKTYIHLQQFENAAIYFNKLIEIEPNNINYLTELGNVYYQRKWYPEAIEALGKAVPLIKNDYPDDKLLQVNIDIYKLLGASHYNLNNFFEAEYFFKKGINYFKNDLECNYNLAETLYKLGNYTECIEYYKKYINFNKFNSNLNYIYRQIIDCCLKNDNLQELLLYINKFKSLIKTDEQLNFYTHVLGIYYYSNYELETAIEYFKKCNKTKDYYYFIGGCYYLLHDYKNTKEYLEKAYEFDNTCKPTIQSLCYNELKFKQFERGFEWNEARYYVYAHKYTLPKSLPDWDLKSECKHLLVSGEQGIGDVIQFTRYLIELAQKFPDMKISYLMDLTTFNIIKLDFLDNVTKVTNIPSFDEFDYKLYLFTIPYLMKVRNISPYSGQKYIETNNELTDKWKATLDEKFPDNKPRIAVFWSGFTTQFIEKTIKLNEFQAIGNLDVHLISIQKGSGEEELISTKTNITSFNNFDNGKAFEDTIAILQNVDLLITIDTSVAHIAGLLGIKTWMILGDIYDWRWFRNEKRTDWYESVELFRANKPRDWTPVLETIHERLIAEFKLNKTTETPEVPVSLGELFDKYSILEIKAEKISNPEKLSHVKNELEKLRPITERFKIEPMLYYDLINVNKELWEIEDRIRILEKKQDFSCEFIKLARSVYFKNDRRGDIKGKINKFFNSDIHEVKEYIDYTNH